MQWVHTKKLKLLEECISDAFFDNGFRNYVTACEGHPIFTETHISCTVILLPVGVKKFEK